MRRKIVEVTPVFVDEIPSLLEQGKLYLSCRYRAAVHLCACGCGAKISTPLHPTGWQLWYDGETVSLSPSVGNWSEKCQSHYVISDNKILWDKRLPRDTIQRIREQRRRELAEYYGIDDKGSRTLQVPPIRGWWAKIRDLFRLTKR